MTDETKRAYWVDAAKFMAIFAVMLDHTEGLLYTNPDILKFSYYSVSLFIFVMGVTNYWSYARYKGSVIRKAGTGCWKIIRPYLVSTFIYSILIDSQFHFVGYITRVVHFNAILPFYYVLLYLQLLLLVPVLYSVLKYADNVKYGAIVEIVGLIIVLVISSLTTNYSDILNVYGGGGKLFGGTYLVLLYLGMLFGKHCGKNTVNRIVLLIAFIIMVGITTLWWHFITVDNLKIDTYLPYGKGLNPPSLSIGLYAVLMACTIYLLGEVLALSARLTKAFGMISSLGKHTLYIFLYHRLFFGFVLPALFARTGIVIANIWLLRIVYFLCMIGGSIIIEVVLERIHLLLKRAYMPRCSDGIANS